MLYLKSKCGELRTANGILRIRITQRFLDYRSDYSKWMQLCETDNFSVTFMYAGLYNIYICLCILL